MQCFEIISTLVSNFINKFPEEVKLSKHSTQFNNFQILLKFMSTEVRK